MNFIDKAPITGLRRTDDGYAVAEVPVARTGIQNYAGYEVGRPDLKMVSVYRPADTVFDEGSMATAAHKPVTDDHPQDSVTANNWDGIAKGWTGETVRKDEANGLLYIPMLLADGKLIDKLEAGKREVSCGYSCELVWGDGVAPDGARYQATQKNVIFNHVAVVDRGRAGNICRVGDNWQPITDNKEPLVATKVITFDGLPVEVTDAAEAVINKVTGQLADANAKLSDAQTKEGAAVALVSTRDGEIVALKAQLEDAKVTPEKLAEMVADRSAIIDAAKAIAPDIVTDGLTDAEIRKAAVVAKLGGKAPTADAAIEGAFAVYAAGVVDADPLRDAIKDGVTVIDADKVVDDARAEMNARLHNPLKQDA